MIATFGRRAALVLTLAGALLAALLAGGGPAVALGDTKPFTPTLSPSAVGGGARAPLTLTVANGSTQGLGSANVTVPTAWRVVSVGTPRVLKASGAPSGKTWSAALDASGGVIRLRNPGPNSVNRLADGERVVVAITADAPCAAPAGPAATWVTEARQSNDFLGTGNEMTATAQPAVAVQGTCRLAFSGQPSSTRAGAAIGPAGPVTVRVEDGLGALIARPASVAIAIGTNPTGGTLGGTATAATSTGVASFATLAIDRPGTGYTLVASGTLTGGPSLGSAASAPFDILRTRATRLSVVSVNGGTDVVAGQPFAVVVRAVDEEGEPADVAAATTVALTVASGTPGSIGGTTAAVIPAGAGEVTVAGVTLSAIENHVVLRASATAGDALTAALSRPFDVLRARVTVEAFPGVAVAIGTGCTDTTPEAPTCVTADLPNGAVGTVVLQDGSCAGIVAGGCASSLAGLFGELKDPVTGAPLYTRTAPARVTLELDKSISGNRGVAQFTVLAQLTDADPFSVTPDCRRSGVVDAGRFVCVDWRTRDGAGDTLFSIIFWKDIRLTVR